MATAEKHSIPHTLRRSLTSVPALVYLAVVVGLTVWAVVVTAMDDSGESMAGVIPMLATLPLGLLVLALPLPDAPWAFVVPLLLCALVNAVFIGWCVRTLTERLGSGARR